MFNAYKLMLKLVYPSASNTFKVLSNCVVKKYGCNLKSNVTQCILLYEKSYLTVSERLETH